MGRAGGGDSGYLLTPRAGPVAIFKAPPGQCPLPLAGVRVCSGSYGHHQLVAMLKARTAVAIIAQVNSIRMPRPSALRVCQLV